jgi:hypothetical protein
MANGNDIINRTISFKRIVDPDDPDPANPTSYVDVPCILGVRLIDGKDPLQLVRTYDNTISNNRRAVHVTTVKNQSTPDGKTIVADDSNKLDCERVKSCQHVHADWIEHHYFVNGDPAPLPAPIDPAYDPTKGHIKSHVVRYNQANKNDPNETPWVDIELVDRTKIVGMRKERDSDAGQVAIIHLSQDGGDDTFSDPNDPFNPRWGDRDHYLKQNWKLVGNPPPDGKGAKLIMPIDTNGNPDPVRLDPFQNITNCDWGSGLAVEFFDGAN